MNIKAKILIPMVAIALLISAAILVSNILQFSGFVDASVSESVESAAAVAMDNLIELQKEAEIASNRIAEDDDIADALAAGNAESLLSAAGNLQRETEVDFCTITDPQGTVVLRTHEPENSGDSVASQQNVREAMGGGSASLIEPGTAVKLSVRSGAPVRDADGGIVGIVSVGYRLDTETFVDSVKQLLGCEVTVFLGDERISTTVQQQDGSRAIGTKASEDVSAKVLGGTPHFGEASILGRSAMASYSPIKGADGQILGMLFVGHYSDESAATIRGFVISALIITAVMLAVSLAVILVVTKRIVDPIHTMVDAAAVLAAGDTNVNIQVNTKDEMRKLADAFGNMADNIRRQVEVVEHIAAGDLTVSPKVRSERDLMNNAIKSMLELNNGVFSNIAGAAEQVAIGAGRIAEGSDALASGAAEQAAAVQQLSGSIADISEKTKANAGMADRTAKLADSIRQNAEEGSRQMNEMMTAVYEINQSSNNISKVIKVIDDIAFQTNILALNAAVEAARAGQHGKGFAVVAEEVRNLASKSAEAAKDTGTMIQDSIVKAELGSKIAEKTAESISGIISGINESNQLISEIAQSSEEQAMGIQQINIGIDQIAEVVQQTSATAEENAAASQQMSSQSGLLQQLVRNFKLREPESMDN